MVIVFSYQTCTLYILDSWWRPKLREWRSEEAGNMSKAAGQLKAENTMDNKIQIQLGWSAKLPLQTPSDSPHVYQPKSDPYLFRERRLNQHKC